MRASRIISERTRTTDTMLHWTVQIAPLPKKRDRSAPDGFLAAPAQIGAEGTAGAAATTACASSTGAFPSNL